MTALEILYETFKILGFLGVCYILATDATNNILGRKSVWEEMFSERSEKQEDD